MEPQDVKDLLFNYYTNELDTPSAEELDIIKLEQALSTFYNITVMTPLTKAETFYSYDLYCDFDGRLKKREEYAKDLINSLKDLKAEIINEIPEDKIIKAGFFSTVNGSKISLFEFIDYFKDEQGDILFNGSNGFSDIILEKLVTGAFISEFIDLIDKKINIPNAPSYSVLEIPISLLGLWSIWNNTNPETLINIYNANKDFVRPSGKNGKANRGEKIRLYCLANELYLKKWLKIDGVAKNLAIIFNDCFGFKFHNDDYDKFEFGNNKKEYLYNPALIESLKLIGVNKTV